MLFFMGPTLYSLGVVELGVVVHIYFVELQKGLDYVPQGTFVPLPSLSFVLAVLSPYAVLPLFSWRLAGGRRVPPVSRGGKPSPGWESGLASSGDIQAIQSLVPECEETAGQVSPVSEVMLYL